MSDFLAKTIKDQTDSILRRRQVAPGSSVTVRGGTTAPGTGPGTTPKIDDPNRDLDRHKTSGDHDGRYYTEGEVDDMLNFVSLTDTPDAYLDQAGKLAAVNAAEDGMEFVAAPPATNGIPTGGTNNQLLAKDGATDYVVKWMDAPAAANGVPQGGSAGQVLAKVDGEDFNAQWVAPPSGNAIDIPPVSPSIWDDEFDGASLDAKWAWLNQGASSAAVANDRLMVTPQAATGGTRGLLQPAPAGSFMMMTKCTFYAPPVNYTQAGLVLYNSNNSRVIQFGFDRRGSNTWGIRYQRFTNPSTWSADPVSWTGIGLNTLYFKITSDGTYVNTYISPDGDGWILVCQEAISAFLGAITDIGIFVNDNSATVTPARFDWFRAVE